MKIICAASVLAEASFSVARAISSKSKLPVLEGILFKAYGDCVKLTGYDLEIGIETTVSANVLEEGSVVLHAGVFCGIMNKATSDRVIIESKENKTCKIKYGNTEYETSVMNPADYPELPSVANGKEININSRILKDMIKKTIFSASLNDVKVIHKGVRFEIRPGEFRLVAMDPHRIAIRKEKIDYGGEEFDFVIPQKTGSELIKLLPDSDDVSVNICLGSRHLLFKAGEYTVISRLLEGEFMRYESIIPNDFNTIATAKTRDLIESLEKVNLVTTERFKAPLKLNFKDDSLNISAATALGSAFDNIDLPVEGKDIEIGVQGKYMLDALRAGEEEKVLIKMITPLSPIIITPVGEETFLYLILPVKLNK